MAKQSWSSGQVLTAASLTALQANDYNLTVNTSTASYVLVASDVGTRRVMNAAGATTITVNNSIFSAGDSLWIHNIGAGTCTVTAGTCTVNTASSLALAQWEGGVLYFTSAASAIFFRGAGPTYGVATGGTGVTSVTIGGVNYNYTSFTASGTLTVTRAGLFDVLVCAGGGGGGSNGFTSTSARSVGGGGAGGILQSTIYLSANQTVTIGAGGSGGTQSTALATAGSSSSIGDARGVSVAGGGAGMDVAWGADNIISPAQPGGSGGGGANYSIASFRNGASSMAPTVSGYAGGNGVNSNTAGQGGGGGGGATAVGANAATTTGGAGGAGYDVSAFIGGSALFKCGGGGGGGTTGGAGGSSVGGAGGSATNGSSAAANTASGGGGAGSTTATANGGSGGSGIVYIRWKV